MSEEPGKAENTEAEESRLRGGSEIRRSYAFNHGGERKSLQDVSAKTWQSRVFGPVAVRKISGLECASVLAKEVCAGMRRARNVIV